MMSDGRRQKPDRGEVRVNAVLRDRRQVTIPRAVCEEMGIHPGDRLELRVEDGTLMVRPGRGAAPGGRRGIPQARGGATGERPPGEGRTRQGEVATPVPAR